jgi:hypothetical protein
MKKRLWALTVRVRDWISHHAGWSTTALLLVALILVLVLDWGGSSAFTHAHYRLLLWLSILPGAIASGVFIAAHRPSKWFDRTAINASGWLIIVFLFYVRSLVTLVTQRTVTWRGMPNALWAIGVVVIIDALLILRVISFIQYRRAFRRRRQELEAELAEEYGSLDPSE